MRKTKLTKENEGWERPGGQAPTTTPCAATFLVLGLTTRVYHNRDHSQIKYHMQEKCVVVVDGKRKIPGGAMPEPASLSAVI